MKIINPFKSKYFLAFLGLIFLFYYIWYRFIRERLPREIPFQPTVINLLFLILISLTYAYILLRIFKPKPPHPLILKLLQILNPILQPLFKPWYALDKVFRENKYFHRYFITYLVLGLKYITNAEKNIKLYIIWYILPRVILLSLLLIDTFYYHKLQNIYTFGFLTLFILFCYYIIYALRITIKEYIEYLDYYFEVIITSEDFEGSNYFIDIEDLKNATEMKIQAFINYQTSAFCFDNTPYTYEYNFIERYNTNAEFIVISKNQSNFLIKEFYRLLPITVILNLFVDSYDYCVSGINRKKTKKTNSETKMFLKVKRVYIIITSLYLLTWLYILIVTLYTLPESSFEILKNIQDTIEPFSGLNLNQTHA